MDAICAKCRAELPTKDMHMTDMEVHGVTGGMVPEVRARATFMSHNGPTRKLAGTCPVDALGTYGPRTQREAMHLLVDEMFDRTAIVVKE